MGCIPHLGDGFGMDEGRNLHMLHAGGNQRIDDLQFFLCRKVFFQVLEPITGSHFDDFNLLSHCSMHLSIK